MTGCSRFGADVSAYRDDELERGARAAFDAHLPGCAACRGALASLARLDQALRALPRAEPSPGFERRFWSRLEDLESAGPAPDRSAGWLAGLRARWRSPGDTRRGTRAADWLLPAGAAAALACALLLALPRLQEPGPVDRDWLLASDAEGFELVLAEDPELLHDLELLEVWDGLEEI